MKMVLMVMAKKIVNALLLPAKNKFTFTKTVRMISSAANPSQYITELPSDRKEPFNNHRETILKNIPKGFEEIIANGMISYVVPHSVYPDGYHCDPKQPLPFISIASQKNFIAFYHMGMYAQPTLLNWFVEEYPKHSNTKLDMGKSCIRFKKPDQIPFKLLGELVKKVSADEWIGVYEEIIKK